jgi:hypothetical protein
MCVHLALRCARHACSRVRPEGAAHQVSPSSCDTAHAAASYVLGGTSSREGSISHGKCLQRALARGLRRHSEDRLPQIVTSRPPYKGCGPLSRPHPQLLHKQSRAAPSLQRALRLSAPPRSSALLPALLCLLLTTLRWLPPHGTPGLITATRLPSPPQPHKASAPIGPSTSPSPTFTATEISAANLLRTRRLTNTDNLPAPPVRPNNRPAKASPAHAVCTRRRAPAHSRAALEPQQSTARQSQSRRRRASRRSSSPLHRPALGSRLRAPQQSAFAAPLAAKPLWRRFCCNSRSERSSSASARTLVVTPTQPA